MKPRTIKKKMVATVKTVHVTREVIRDVLSCDAYCRKVREWPLIKMESPSDESKYRVLIEQGIVHVGYANPQSRGQFRLESIEAFRINLTQDVHYVDRLLELYRGNLFLCGGAVCAVLKQRSVRDADFFFVGLSEEGATKALQGCVHVLTSSGKRSVVIRSKYVTTVYLSNGGHEEEKYQFIHRIYERLDLVLGGFDLTYCGVAYDGQDIFFTPAAYFSHGTDLILVDVSRRSPSFEQRIIKYSRRYRIGVIFPGLTIPRITEVQPGATTAQGALVLPFMTLPDHHADGNFGRPVKRMPRSSDQTPSDYEGSDVTAEHSQAALNTKFAAMGKLEYIATFSGSKGQALEFHPVPSQGPLSVQTAIEYAQTKKYVKLCELFTKTTADALIRAVREIKRDVIGDIVEEFNAKVNRNLQVAQRDLLQVTWITRNPGAQWTSSIQPIVESPAAWYGPVWSPFEVMIPREVETCMRLMRLRDCVWRWLPRDVFKIIVRLVAKLYADAGYNASFLHFGVKRSEKPSAPDPAQADIVKIVEMMSANPNLKSSLKKLLEK